VGGHLGRGVGVYWTADLTDPLGEMGVIGNRATIIRSVKFF